MTAPRTAALASSHGDQRLEGVRIVLVLRLNFPGQQRTQLCLPHRVPDTVVDPALAKHPVPTGVPLSVTPARLGVFPIIPWKALSRCFWAWLRGPVRLMRTGPGTGDGRHS